MTGTLEMNCLVCESAGRPQKATDIFEGHPYCLEHFNNWVEYRSRNPITK